MPRSQLTVRMVRVLLEREGVRVGLAIGVMLILFLLALPLWATIGAPVLLYVGLRWGVAPLSARGEADSAFAEPAHARMSDLEILKLCRQKAATMRTLGQEIANPEVRRLAADLADQADAILGAAEEDGKLNACRTYLELILDPAEDRLEWYRRMSRRNVTAAQPRLAGIEREELPLLLDASHQFYEKLHEIDMREADALGEVLRFNLEGLAHTRLRSLSS